MGTAPAACRCCAAGHGKIGADAAAVASMPREGSLDTQGITCTLFGPNQVGAEQLVPRKLDRGQKVGLSPAEDFWGEETVTTNGAVVLAEGFDNPLDGLWNDRGRHHIIQGESLTWSDGRDTTIRLDTKTSFSILFKGNTVSGKLDDTSKCILWSDNDVWERVCLDGVWVDGEQLHQIDGTVLKWNDECSTKLTDLRWYSAKRAVEGSNGQAESKDTVEGLLDASGDRLSWSNNEVWLRAGLDGIWCESKHPCCHTLKGSSLKRHSGQIDHIDVLTKNVMMLNIDGISHEACMSQLGHELRWSDGDVWTRVLSNEPNNVNFVGPL